jgi:hypothetical protein
MDTWAAKDFTLEQPFLTWCFLEESSPYIYPVSATEIYITISQLRYDV